MAEEFITGTGYKPNAYVIQKYTEGTIFTVDLIRNSATGQKSRSSERSFYEMVTDVVLRWK